MAYTACGIVGFSPFIARIERIIAVRETVNMIINTIAQIVFVLLFMPTPFLRYQL